MSVDRARQLRREQTVAEGLLWSRLRSRRLEGYRFRRQHPLGPYVLDFYCPDARLCVWNDEVMTRMEVVLDVILTTARARCPSPPTPLPASGERGE